MTSRLIAHLARSCYPFHPFGGLEQHVYQLTKELVKLGHTVRLYTQPPAPGLPSSNFNSNSSFEWPEGVEHYYLPYQLVKLLRPNSIPDRLLNYPIFSLKLARLVKQLTPAPDVVHAHGLAAFGYGLQPLPGVPLVLNPHGMEEFKNPSWAKHLAYTPFRQLVRQAAKASARIIATDQNLVAEVKHFLRVPEDKIAVIPNAIDLETFDQKLAHLRSSSAAITKQAEFLILSVGRLEENKGFDVGLAALAKLKGEVEELPENWQWVIVGEGSQRRKLEQQASEAGLGQQVSFCGALSDNELYGLYQQAELFMHPALYEGSSIVTLEALATGIPVVASAVGGIPDKIRESGVNENGRLVTPGDPLELACKIKELARLPLYQRRNLGQGGRQMVEAHFSWQAAARATAELYESILSSATSNKPVLRRLKV